MHILSYLLIIFGVVHVRLSLPTFNEELLENIMIESVQIDGKLKDLLKHYFVSQLSLDMPIGNNGTIALIESAGYPAETHMVTTEDCYILQMHRIPHGKKEWGINATSVPRPVVFLQHGLLGCSDNWVLSFTKPSESLGYILADSGYDVWLGNYRGNNYGMEHCFLDSNEMKFWDFSWDESAEYDLPAMINKVLETTNQDKLFYVGHSMGTTAFMAMAATKPEMREKIIMANLLSPVAFVEHMRSPVRILAPYAEDIKRIMDLLGVGMFPPPIINKKELSRSMNSEYSKYDNDETCDLDFNGIVLGMLMGFDQEQCNKTMVQYASLSTSSVRTQVHYAQEVNSGHFCKYDFGATKNMEKYGQEHPPIYDIKNIDIPTATYWGDNDWLAEPTDVFRLTSQLPNLIQSYRVPWDKWNHVDYINAKDADTLLYPEVLKNMEKFRA